MFGTVFLLWLAFGKSQPRAMECVIGTEAQMRLGFNPPDDCGYGRLSSPISLSICDVGCAVSLPLRNMNK